MMTQITIGLCLDIDGSRVSKRYRSTGLSIALIAIAYYLWTFKEVPANAPAEDLTEMLMARCFSLVAFFIGITWAPASRHTFLDFENQQLVTIKYYAWLMTSMRSRPLSDFSHIVVRQVCFPNDEGESFTASIGLKPTDSSPVLWVKNYPLVQEAIPLNAYEFARELGQRTGLPIAKNDPS